MSFFDLDQSTGAVFSEDLMHRYTLWRRWGSGGMLNFIGLNPSTATAEISDPTVTRMINRAKAMGFGGLFVTNIFALRSTDPKGLLGVTDPIGPRNDEAIREIAKVSEMVICGWGSASKLVAQRAAHVRSSLVGWGLHERVYALKVSDRTGMPWHPLYLPSFLEPFRWN